MFGLTLGLFLFAGTAPVPAAPAVPAADARRYAASADPLLAYTNGVHNPDGFGTYKRIARVALPTAQGTAGVVGYSNTETAPHATWGNVWFLITPQGAVFEIGGLEGPGGAPKSGSHDGHPAVSIPSGDMHQGIGYEASTLVFHDGHEYRYYTETQNLDESAEGEDSAPSATVVTKGALVLIPLPAGLAQKLPPLRSFPRAPAPVPVR